MASDKPFTVDQLVQAIMADPKLPQALEEIGHDYVDVIKQTWPKSIGNETTKKTRKSEVFEVVPSNKSGDRPWVHVHVNHPYAVAHQARTGAFTKGAGVLGLEFNNGGG